MEALLERITEVPADHYRRLKISDLNEDELFELSQIVKLSLSREDMGQVQEIDREGNREGVCGRRRARNEHVGKGGCL